MLKKFMDELKSVIASLESYAANFPDRLAAIKKGEEKAIIFYKTYRQDVVWLCEVAEMFGVTKTAADICLAAVRDADMVVSAWEKAHGAPAGVGVPTPTPFNEAAIQSRIDTAVATALASFASRLTGSPSAIASAAEKSDA